MSPSRLRERAQEGDFPPPGTRVVVARIAGEATEGEASRVAQALVGLRGVIAEGDSEIPVVPEDTATVRLDGTTTATHFAWTELELEDDYDASDGDRRRTAQRERTGKLRGAGQ